MSKRVRENLNTVASVAEKLHTSYAKAFENALTSALTTGRTRMLEAQREGLAGFWAEARYGADLDAARIAVALMTPRMIHAEIFETEQATAIQTWLEANAPTKDWHWKNAYASELPNLYDDAHSSMTEGN